MKKLYKRLALSFLMMIWFLGLAEIGSAYCVYNDSSVTLYVTGGFCIRCYEGTLHSGAHGCCPGGDAGCGGTTMIYVLKSSLSYLYCPCAVTAHGWVTITGPDLDHLYVHVYNDYGNQICEGQMICCYSPD